jgi:hypothetical protein
MTETTNSNTEQTAQTNKKKFKFPSVNLSKLFPKKKDSTIPADPNAPAPKTKFKVNLKVVLLAFLVIVVALVGSVATKYLIAASVNGKPIYRIDVIKQLEKVGGKQTLDSMISKAVILQEAKKRGIAVSQTDIDTEVKKIEGSLTAQNTTLDAALKQQGLTQADLIENVTLNLMLDKMVSGNITVSDAEITQYMTENKQYLPAADPKDPQQTALKAQIKDLLMQQKLSSETETFITNLKNAAKIRYYVSY